MTKCRNRRTCIDGWDHDAMARSIYKGYIGDSPGTASVSLARLDRIRGLCSLGPGLDIEVF